MPSRKRPAITDTDAAKIEAAYYRAKTANPKLTQREFVRKAMPTIQRRVDEAKTPEERQRIESSGARYLRLILEGKRTGRVNVREAQRFRPGQGTDQFQATIRGADGEYRSFDVYGVGARSQLDVPLMEVRLREQKELFGKKLVEWRRRYADAFADLDVDDLLETLEVRRVQVFRKHAEHITL